MILSNLPGNSAGHYSEEPHKVAQTLCLAGHGRLDLGLAVASLTQGIYLANKWLLAPSFY